jgi:hypothetical protein
MGRGEGELERIAAYAGVDAAKLRALLAAGEKG